MFFVSFWLSFGQFLMGKILVLDKSNFLWPSVAPHGRLTSNYSVLQPILGEKGVKMLSKVGGESTPKLTFSKLNIDTKINLPNNLRRSNDPGLGKNMTSQIN